MLNVRTREGQHNPRNRLNHSDCVFFVKSPSCQTNTEPWVPASPDHMFDAFPPPVARGQKGALIDQFEAERKARLPWL